MSADSVQLVTVGAYGACPLCHDEPRPVTHACPWHPAEAACWYHATLMLCRRCNGELVSIAQTSRLVSVRTHDAATPDTRYVPKPVPPQVPKWVKRGKTGKGHRGKGKRGR